jgi:hypothetical protein
MLSRSVKPAGDRHSCRYVASADAQTNWLPADDARNNGKVLPGGGADRGRRSKRQVRWALFVCTRLRVRLGSRTRAGAACAGYSRARQAGARAATAGPDAQGRRDCRHWDGSRPHAGCVRPERPASGRHGQRAVGVTLARSVRRYSLWSCGALLQKAVPGRPQVIRAAGLSTPRRCGARRRQECRDHHRRSVTWNLQATPPANQAQAL